MHFNNNFPDAKYSAQQMFEELYSIKLDSIFEKGFSSGGLRGDPYLWEELVDRLKMKPVPKSIFLFYKLINDEITDILGQPLEKGKRFIFEDLKAMVLQVVIFPRIFGLTQPSQHFCNYLQRNA